MAFNPKDRSNLALPLEKECGRCNLNKPSKDFHLDMLEKDLLKWACKACVKSMNKLADEKKLAYKPFSALLQKYLMEGNAKRLHTLMKKVYETAVSDSKTAVLAQKIVIERLEGKLKEEVAITADSGTVQLISDANELLKKIKAPRAEEELQIPVSPDMDEKRTIN